MPPQMAPIPKAQDLAKLSVDERLELMDELWASLQPEADSLPMTEWNAAEIRRRLEAFEKDGNRGRPAEEVFAELKRKL